MARAEEILPERAWCVENLLSAEECQEVIRIGQEEYGIVDKVPSGDRRYRNCCTEHFNDQELTDRIWQRLQNIVPEQYILDTTQDPPPGLQACTVKEMPGSWKPCGCSNRFTLLYYQAGGHFGPHRDSVHSPSEHQRSLLTVSIYLNDRPQGSGGATQFLMDDMEMSSVDENGRICASDDQTIAVMEADTAGKAVVFCHDLLHQGEPLTRDAEPKWLLITQVLYQRDPASVPQLTDQQREARQLLQAAEEAEVGGDISGAIRLYNRAFKLDPTLDHNAE